MKMLDFNTHLCLTNLRQFTTINLKILMNEEKQPFLTTEEIRNLLSMLRKKNREEELALGENPDELERKNKEYYSLLECEANQDLLMKMHSRDRLDAVSGHFRIPFNVLCAMPIIDVDLLYMEWVRVISPTEFSEYFPLSFEGEQQMADMDKKIEQAGGIVQYLKKWAIEKKKKPAQTSPLLPKQKYRQ